jgi:predicted dinucleotide-binding enzyme
VRRLPPNGGARASTCEAQAASFGRRALPTHPSPTCFYASDDRDAGNAVAELIKASGFAPVRIGGIDQSIRTEAFGDLHESGKLGKLVTAKEAAVLV